MKTYNILLFPCGTEIANEINNSLQYHKYFKLLYASSEDKSYCSFITDDIIKLPYVNSNKFLKELNEVINKNKIDFIIPAHDDVAYELSQKQEFIDCQIINQSKETNQMVRFKDKTYKFFKEKLPIPKIYNSIPLKEDFPVFVKPKRGQGSFNAIKLNNLYEYESFFKIHNINDFVVMELLTGTEYTIDCFSDNGKLLYFGARTRDKTMKGITVVSSFVNNINLNKDFEKYANIISNGLNMNGVWFFQMKMDKNDNLKLLEIGPRIAGSMILNRMRGINFIELAIYQALGYKVDVSVNNINELHMGRALSSKFKISINYDNLYVDFDDTLFLEEKKINSELMKLIFEVKNKKKRVVLITKNKKNNLTKVLHQFGITNIFDEIIHIDESDKKINYIQPKSLLIDDSYSERKEAINAGFYAFGIDMISLLINN